MLVKFLVGSAEDLTKGVVTDTLISTFLTPETIMLPVKLTSPWTVATVMLDEKAGAMVFKAGERVGTTCLPIIVETVEDKPFMLAVQIVPYSSQLGLQLTYSWPSGERGNFAMPSGSYYTAVSGNSCGPHTHSYTVAGSSHAHTTGVSTPQPALQVLAGPLANQNVGILSGLGALPPLLKMLSRRIKKGTP